MPGQRVRRGFGALSTSASRAESAPSWKLEVNQRLQEHKSRKGFNHGEPQAPTVVHPGVSGRAAEAAARVAARYAKAPSYSEMLAAEARAAVRAAEAASRAALEAQAAAESVLSGLEAASGKQSMREPEVSVAPAPEQVPEPAWEARVEPVRSAAPQARQIPLRQPYGICWEQDMPVRPPAHLAAREVPGPGVLDLPLTGWGETAQSAQDAQDAEAIEPVEPAKPIPANLIEFPRELVAARKARPRRVEGPYAVSQPEAQLSIFEVDPGSISTQPAAADSMTEPVAHEWSGIELEAQTPDEAAHAEAAAPLPLQLAPMSLRLMAFVVDGALIAGALLAAAAVAMQKVNELPTMKEIEMGAAAALAVFGALYHVLFFTLADGTPGMKYARISLCTFDDEKPTRAQKRSRLGALLLSLAPVGLGVAWAIFDQEHLSWHDRLSRTYLRKC